MTQGIIKCDSVKKPQRNRHAGWSFLQLRSFVAYKAALAGIPVVLVDPRNTSRTCNACGHCEKANRKSRSAFECHHCGHAVNADLNAARNIRAKAVVKLPMVGSGQVPPPEGGGLRLNSPGVPGRGHRWLLSRAT
jgi:transposase